MTRLKAEPQRFPKLDLAYSSEQPIDDPVTLTLPSNGLRLRFDGPEQRLRLIEVIDFTKNHITFKERDLVKPVTSQNAPSSPGPGDSSSGPSFRHIYHRLLGPTYGGEYIPPETGSFNEPGNYVLSYPGVAFTFPLSQSAYSPDKDVVSLLSSSGAQVATSMAIFNGDSWAQARENLWTEVLPSLKTVSVLPRGKDVVPDEVSMVKIHGGGKLELFRKWTTSSFTILLGDTTPQDLVAELGPPNAIYRKNDQRMTIHRLRTASHSRTHTNGTDMTRPDELTDTDQSSAQDGSDDSQDEAIEDDIAGHVSGECFYNYFYLGFDILVSTPAVPSPMPPSAKADDARQTRPKLASPDRLVATKFVLHGNVPGSYEFNRHRRCRWEISYLNPLGAANSESRFPDIEAKLNDEWNSTLPAGDSRRDQRGMVLNRGWGDSPGSSVEFLGGWEDHGGNGRPQRLEGGDDSTTTLFGFPGLVFEVLRNGHVNAVTVY